MQNNDLISRSALLKSFKRSCLGECEFCPRAIYSPDEPEIICGLIQCAPAVDPEPVRHGKYGFVGMDMMAGSRTFYFGTCSECHERINFEAKHKNYCPHCGAKMTDEKARDLKPCDNCEHYEWDMPQCKECNPENGFKWHKRR